MRNLFLFIILLLTTFKVSSQIQDTIYIDEIDTVLVAQKPLVINQTFYSVTKSKKQFAFFLDGGVLKDYSYSDVCETCKENYSILKNSSKPTKTIQFGLKSYYQFKKISIGIEANYRNAKKSINYNNDSTIQFNNKTTVNYFMIGPMIGYKILKKKKWDLDIFGSVNFSFTLKQSGISLGGPNITTQIDLSNTPLYSTHNLLYHLSPSLTYKIHESLGISISTHYYFDNNSNLNKTQSYTEQRNSLGFTLGLKYLI